MCAGSPSLWWRCCELDRERRKQVRIALGRAQAAAAAGRGVEVLIHVVGVLALLEEEIEQVVRALACREKTVGEESDGGREL